MKFVSFSSMIFVVSFASLSAVWAEEGASMTPFTELMTNPDSNPPACVNADSYCTCSPNCDMRICKHDCVCAFGCDMSNCEYNCECPTGKCKMNPNIRPAPPSPAPPSPTPSPSCKANCSCDKGGCDLSSCKIKCSCAGGNCKLDSCKIKCSCTGGGCTYYNNNSNNNNNKNPTSDAMSSFSALSIAGAFIVGVAAAVMI